MKYVTGKIKLHFKNFCDFFKLRNSFLIITMVWLHWKGIYFQLESLATGIKITYFLTIFRMARVVIRYCTVSADVFKVFWQYVIKECISWRPIDFISEHLKVWIIECSWLVKAKNNYYWRILMEIILRPLSGRVLDIKV